MTHQAWILWPLSMAIQLSSRALFCESPAPRLPIQQNCGLPWEAHGMHTRAFSSTTHPCPAHFMTRYLTLQAASGGLPRDEDRQSAPGSQLPGHSPGILLAREAEVASSIAGLGVSILAAMQAGTKPPPRTPHPQEVPRSAGEPAGITEEVGSPPQEWIVF